MRERCCLGDAGTMLASEPVSTRDWMLVMVSRINRRLVFCDDQDERCMKDELGHLEEAGLSWCWRCHDAMLVVGDGDAAAEDVKLSGCRSG